MMPFSMVTVAPLSVIFTPELLESESSPRITSLTEKAARMKKNDKINGDFGQRIDSLAICNQGVARGAIPGLEINPTCNEKSRLRPEFLEGAENKGRALNKPAIDFRGRMPEGTGNSSEARWLYHAVVFASYSGAANSWPHRFVFVKPILALAIQKKINPQIVKPASLGHFDSVEAS
jgi:hypothetical protein